MSKVVKVFSTKGNRMTEVTTSANTWGELKQDLDKNNIQYDGMEAVVRENKTILRLDDAVLPKGLTVGDQVSDNFCLFLTPAKMKAGSSTHAELKAFIKGLRDGKKYSNEAKEWFGNYTQKSTSELQELVSEWKDNHKPAKKAKAVIDEAFEEFLETDDKDILAKILNLVNQQLEILKGIPGLVENTELKQLEEEAAAIEFELSH